MTDNRKNDLFYVCSLIEYIARKTCNRRGVVIYALGKNEIQHQLEVACVNHCLSFEQVSDELIEAFKIPSGDFDTISDCKYKVPSHQDIGRLYQIIITDCAKEGNEVSEFIKVFTSIISDAISDFSTDMYYQNPSYLEACYKADEILE